MNSVTRILADAEQGDPQAAEQLLPLVYDELRKLAAQKLAQERPGLTLQATALVHEAYLRLVDTEKVQSWESRGHFFAAAAEAMRRILVDESRRKSTSNGAACLPGTAWSKHLWRLLAASSTSSHSTKRWPDWPRATGRLPS
jgi:RNA polymerase sigma factor (TIGR02999 family)